MMFMYYIPYVLVIFLSWWSSNLMKDIAYTAKSGTKGRALFSVISDIFIFAAIVAAYLMGENL